MTKEETKSQRLLKTLNSTLRAYDAYPDMRVRCEEDQRIRNDFFAFLNVFKFDVKLIQIRELALNTSRRTLSGLSFGRASGFGLVSPQSFVRSSRCCLFSEDSEFTFAHRVARRTVYSKARSCRFNMVSDCSAVLFLPQRPSSRSPKGSRAPADNPRPTLSLTLCHRFSIDARSALSVMCFSTSSKALVPQT